MFSLHYRRSIPILKILACREFYAESGNVRNFWFPCVELEKSRSEWNVVEKTQNRRFWNFKSSYLCNGWTKIKNSKRFLISTNNCIGLSENINKCKIKNGRVSSEKVDSYREWLLRTPAIKIYWNANVDLSPIRVILGPYEPHTKVSSLAQYRDFTLHIGGLAGLWNFEHFLTWKMGCFGDFSNISRSPWHFLMFFFWIVEKRMANILLIL